MRNCDRLSRWAALFTAIIVALACDGCSRAGKPPVAQNAALERSQQSGADRFRRGDYAGAAEQWKRAADLAQIQSRTAARTDALINLGSAYQMLGQYELAKAALDEALQLAEEQHDTGRTITALNDLAAACTLKPDPVTADAVAATRPAGEDAHGMPHDSMSGHVHSARAGDAIRPSPKALLSRALLLTGQMPQDARAIRLQASIHDNLGNYYSDNKEFEDAALEYSQCVQLAKLNDPLLGARGSANAATAELAAGDSYTAQAARAEAARRKRDRDMAPGLRQKAAERRAQAVGDNAEAFNQAIALPASATKAFLLNQIGQTDQKLAEFAPADAGDLADRARRAYVAARQTAEASGDTLSLSYACGYLGHLDEVAEQPATSIKLTREAIAAASEARSADSLYRWQWQLGRLLKNSHQGDPTIAIGSYQQAVETVKSIRNDIALGNGNQRNRSSFRNDVVQMYFELADLLLQKNAATKDPAAAQAMLLDVRSTLESVKSAELEDYLRDDCVQLFKARGGQKLEDTGVDGCALIYVVPLEDRIELLVQVRSHLYEKQSPVSRAVLKQTVGDFAKLVRSIESSEYKTSGGQLYQWLIRPLEGLLREQRIDTLVFIPDEMLRTVPMSALYDEQTGRHLIERYAVAVVPGLELTEGAEANAPARQTLLVSGLSQSRGQFPALPYVPIELTNVQQAFHAGSSRELLNSRFILENLRSEVHSRRYSVMHIASHGHFGEDASKTFILTFDEQQPLTLDELEKLIRPQQYDPNGRPQPVDLLVLSCCQTALGDDRAALGLGGIAVKSGARSALATLWSVNDQSSTVLISEFYRQLAGGSESPGTPAPSKAKALQEAQKRLIHDDNLVYGHPFFWAPYLIIGNWQ